MLLITYDKYDKYLIIEVFFVSPFVVLKVVHQQKNSQVI